MDHTESWKKDTRRQLTLEKNSGEIVEVIRT